MFKRFFTAFTAIFTAVLLTVTANASYDGFVENNPRLNDSAELLSEWEQSELLERLDEVSHANGFDIVIYTTPDLGDYTDVAAFADDYYDNGDFGYGADRDGVLFVISMAERDWYISTCGYGISLFYDDYIQYIGSEVVSYLSSGDYASAFNRFVDICESALIYGTTGGYDNSLEPGIDDFYVDPGIDDFYADPGYSGNYYYSSPKEEVNLFSAKYILIAAILGAVISLVVVLIMRGKLKTVHFQSTANSYIKSGSTVLTDNRDVYLYRNVSKTPIPKNNNSGSHHSGGGGGSSVHTSSSGVSHGGGGGKF